MSKTSRCEMLRNLGKVKKPIKKPPLSKIHREKRVQWAEQYVKMDFKNVVFTDECRATLDGPDGWSSGWVLNGRPVGSRIRRQQGDGGVMFWAGIKDQDIIGPFRVPQGVKIDSKGYCQLLTDFFLPYLEDQTLLERKSLVSQQDNAPAHESRYTQSWLMDHGFKERRLMVWPPNSPELNLIENLWAIIKQRVYADGRQFNTLDELWNAVLEACRSIKQCEIRKLTPQLISVFFTSSQMEEAMLTREVE